MSLPSSSSKLFPAHSLNVFSLTHVRESSVPAPQPPSSNTGPTSNPLTSESSRNVRHRMEQQGRSQYRQHAKNIFADLIDPNKGKACLQPGDEWVESLLANMQDAGLITQTPAEFLYGPAATVKDLSTIRDINTQYSGRALSGEMGRDAVTTKAAAKAAGIPNVMVLGFRGRTIDEPRRQTQLDRADVIVLGKGDPCSFHQYFEAEEYLSRSRTSLKNSKTLFITDWKHCEPFLEKLCGKAPPGREREFYQEKLEKRINPRFGKMSRNKVYLVDGADEMVRTCEAQNIGKNRDRHLDDLFPEQTNIPHLFVGTTKEMKIKNWRDALTNDSLTISSLMEVFNDLGDPKEQLKGYVGNAQGIAEGDRKNTDAEKKNKGWGSSFAKALRKSAHLAGKAKAQDASTDAADFKPAPGKGMTGKSIAFATVMQQALRGEHQKISREAFLERLQAFGIDAEKGDKLHFIADDRGFEFPDWQKLEPYFPAEVKAEILAEIEKQVGPQDPAISRVPGVETTWWTNKGGGTKAIMQHVWNAYDRYEAETGERLERKVVSVCALSTIQMDLKTGDYKPPRSYTGSTTYEFKRPPEGSNADDSEAWYVPQTDNPEGKTVQQLIEETEEGKSAPIYPWTKAIDAMRADGFSFINSRPKNLVDDYRVAFIGAPGDTRGESWEQDVRAHAAKEKWKDRPGTAGQIARLSTPAPRTAAVAEAAPTGFDPYEIGKIIHDNDTFVFDSAPPSDDLVASTQLLYKFFSVLVDKSIHPDQKNKLVLVNAKDERLQLLRKIVETQHQYGLSDDPILLMNQYRSDSEAKAKLKTHWGNYERTKPSVHGDPSDEANQFDIRQELNEGREIPKPSVVVLASGKSVETGLVSETHVASEHIAVTGNDAIYGGGAKGLMGEFYKHYQEIAQRENTGGRIAGISTTVVLGKETATNELPESLDKKHTTTDIITRMMALFSADAGVFLGGGIGTTEEIGFALVLKAVGHPLVKDKPLFLVNSLTHDGGRLCDAVMEFFGYDKDSSPEQRRQKGTQILREMGVHVVEADDMGGEDFKEKFARQFDEFFVQGKPVEDERMQLKAA